MTNRRVLGVVTSVESGFWLAELAHPYHFTTQAGFTVDLASPAGGPTRYAPYSDPRIEGGPEAGDLIGLGFLHRQQAMDLLADTRKTADIDPTDYAGVFFVGGTGPLQDFPDDPGIAALVEGAWDAGRVVAAICHGVAGLLGARTAGGDPLISGHEVTGFSRAEDQQLEAMIPGFRLPFYVQDRIEATGARYSDGGPHAAHTVASGQRGRLLTGQNQQSATRFGHELAHLLLDCERTTS